MKNTVLKNTARILLLATIFLSTACEDYFTNPMKDKETGEDITLLILDFNFFKTRMTYHFKDVVTGETITADAKITFSGKNANDIVNYSGEKKPQFETSQGQLELTVDPNVAISESSPFEFAVAVEIPGYNLLERSISINSEGIKTIELQLSKKSDETETELSGGTENGIDTVFHFIIKPGGIKSVKMPAYQVNYTLTMSNLLKFKDVNGNLIFASQDEALAAYKNDPENFMKVTISKFNDYKPGIEAVKINGVVKNLLFYKLETGKMTSMVIAGKKVGSLNGGVILSDCSNASDFLPQIFGFTQFENSVWKLLGTQIFHKTVDFSYTLATVSTDDLCSKGASVTIKSNVKSCFSLVADVYDSSDKFITTLFFKGNFPETFILENVPAKAAKLVFRNNLPSFKPIAPVAISNLCSGNYEVNVEAVSGYQQYQVVLTALCPDNMKVAIAPSYGAEVRLKNTNDTWQGIEMKGGIVDLLGLPDREYEIRLLWDKEWEYSSYWTKFDAKGNYIGAPESNATIVSKKLEDGRIQISVKKIFEQNICDDMGW